MGSAPEGWGRTTLKKSSRAFHPIAVDVFDRTRGRGIWDTRSGTRGSSDGAIDLTFLS